MIKFNSKVYDKLKFLAQILLPALGTLYFTLAQIWGLPAAEEVSGTVLAVDTFLGVLLGLSNTAYKNDVDRFDGFLEVEEDGDSKTYSLNLDGDPSKVLEEKEEILFKVTKPS